LRALPIAVRVSSTLTKEAAMKIRITYCTE